MVGTARFFQHPGHRSGMVIRFQQHHIAGAGVVPRRDICQQRRSGGLVHLLQANTSGCSFRINSTKASRLVSYAGSMRLWVFNVSSFIVFFTEYR